MERSKVRGGEEWREKAIEVCAVCVILQARLCMLISRRPVKPKTRHGVPTCLHGRRCTTKRLDGSHGENMCRMAGCGAGDSVGGTLSPEKKVDSSMTHIST